MKKFFLALIFFFTLSNSAQSKIYSFADLELESSVPLTMRELESFHNDVKKMRKWWSNCLNFNLSGKKLKVIIYPSVATMQKSLNLPYWIGGWYQSKTIFLQPIWVLKKKWVYDKILFIEYAHFVLESYLEKPLPPWLGEVIPLFLYYRYSALPYPNFSQRKLPVNFKNFKALLKQLHHQKNIKQFFAIALKWFIFLEKRLGKNFTLKFLRAFRQGQNPGKAIEEVSQKTWEELYQKFAVPNTNKTSKDFIFFR